MSNVTTTKDSFPVMDITHRPKRTQGSNIRSAFQEDVLDLVSNEDSIAPKLVTLERAIEFYESNAEGEFKTLYLQTAKWLRDFMSKNAPPVVAGMDIQKAQELLDKARGR